MTPADSATSSDTRERLLQAAGEVFADVGFDHATTREICRRAKANVAAVNYHFGDKAKLYRETFLKHYRAGLERYPPHMNLPASATAEQRLRAFIESFFLRLFGDGAADWFTQFMLREMIQPTGAMDELIDQPMVGMRNLLIKLIGEIAAAKLSPQQTRHLCQSIVGQIVFHKHCRAVIERLFPDQTYSRPAVAALADHVYTFSLAGIRAAAKEKRR